MLCIHLRMFVDAFVEVGLGRGIVAFGGNFLVGKKEETGLVR